jgi:starvation-inducible DNA-binding protein
MRALSRERTSLLSLQCVAGWLLGMTIVEPSIDRTAGWQRDAGARLQQLLVGTLDLGLLMKQVHWNLRGPGFRSAHLQLDEIAGDLVQYADTLAERAVALGVAPDGRVRTIADSTPLEPLPAGPVPAEGAMAALADRVDTLVSVARGQLGALGGTDLVTQDLVIGFTGMLEKHRWMLRARS